MLEERILNILETSPVIAYSELKEAITDPDLDSTLLAMHDCRIVVLFSDVDSETFKGVALRDGGVAFTCVSKFGG